MVSIWREVLKLDRVGAEDNFFELGGHSLIATRVVARVREVCGVEVQLRDLFETPVLSGLARRIEELRWADENRKVLAESAGAQQAAEEGTV
jgi:hypothetical protein